MKTTAYRITAIAAAMLAGLLFGTGAKAAEAEPSRSQGAALYHRFAITPGGAWGEVSLALEPGRWRVGHPDGPAATADELRAVLAGLASVRIGGRCAGVVEGRTEYPCGFALSRLDVGGIKGERFGGIAGGGAPTFAILPADDADAIEPAADTARQPIATPGGAAASVQRRVEVVASVDWPGAVGIDLGARLSFRFRGVSNALVPSSFDLGSGVVVLRGGRRVPPQQQPSPALRAA